MTSLLKVSLRPIANTSCPSSLHRTGPGSSTSTHLPGKLQHLHTAVEAKKTQRLRRLTIGVSANLGRGPNAALKRPFNQLARAGCVSRKELGAEEEQDQRE